MFSPLGTPFIYTTAGFGRRKNKKMTGVYNFFVYVQTAPQSSSLYIHHHGWAACPHGAPMEVYIESVVVWGSLHIHQEIVCTSHFLNFSGPKAGGCVYIYGVPK